MKKIINTPQDETAMQNQPCSETKCATCFANRGCMYEQYAGSEMYKKDEGYHGSHIIDPTKQAGKRA